MFIPQITRTQEHRTEAFTFLLPLPRNPRIEDKNLSQRKDHLTTDEIFFFVRSPRLFVHLKRGAVEKEHDQQITVVIVNNLFQICPQLRRECCQKAQSFFTKLTLALCFNYARDSERK